MGMKAMCISVLVLSLAFAACESGVEEPGWDFSVDNAPAIGLYEVLGFQRFGLHRF